MSRNSVIEVTGTCLHETDAAMKFSSDDEDVEEPVWIPLSCISYIRRYGKGQVVLHISEWYANEKGLI